MIVRTQLAAAKEIANLHVDGLVPVADYEIRACA